MLPDPTDCRYISPDALESAVQEAGWRLVDIRTSEAFEEARLPRSENRCVYETAFGKAFEEAYPDKATKLVVYGDGGDYYADRMAFGRLRALGYTEVAILDGGLGAWVGEGRRVEGRGKVEESRAPAVRLPLDAARSRIRWVGRNLSNQHDGEVSASGGFLELSADGSPRGGEVTVDLRRMVCHDLADTRMAKMLIDHLASIDFFDVANHPDASFVLRGAEPIGGATYGRPNYRVHGTLQARGRSLDLEIEAMIEPVDTGYVFQSVFDFDRTQLGALYGSGRIFECLGMHLVNDLVSMDVMAVFRKSD